MSPHTETILLSDILTAPAISVSPDEPLDRVLKLMRERRISGVVAVEADKPVGILTERDAVSLAYHHRDPSTLTMVDVMTPRPLTASPHMDYREGYALIARHHVRHLVVTEASGELLGIVTEADFLDHLGTEFLVRFKELGSVMSESVSTLPPDASVDDAVRLMLHQRISCVVIEDGGRPIGILTERDVVGLEASDKVDFDAPLHAVMSQPLTCARITDSLPEAMRLMEAASIRRLAVVDQHDQITGMVTRHDIVKQLYDDHLEHLVDTLQTREQELAEARLQLAEHNELSLLRDLVNQSGDGIFAVRAHDGVIIYANERTLSFLDRAEGQVLGEIITKLTSWFGTKTWEEAIHQLRSHPFLLFEAFNHLEGMADIPIEINIRLVATESGEFVIGSVRDLKAQKSAEAGQARLLQILESAQDFVGFATIDGHVKYINRAGREMVGLTSKDSLEKLSISAFHPAQSSRYLFETAIPEAIASGYWEGDTEFLSADGGTIPASQIVVVHYGSRGSVEYISTIARDISERRASEDRVNQQLAELKRWQKATLGREGRVLELKSEVNALLRELGRPIRYGSAEES